VFSALARIVKEEGVATLWKGNMPNIYRNVAMSVGMLATYDQVSLHHYPIVTFLILFSLHTRYDW
jgi:hypothetical protein